MRQPVSRTGYLLATSSLCLLVGVCNPALPLAHGNTQMAPEVLKLVQIKKRMSRHLERMSDLMCLLTVNRVRLSSKGRATQADAFRLEAAFIGGEEVFSWPDQEEFDERDAPEIIGLGTVSSGLFISTANAIFVHDTARIRFAGEEDVNGRLALRYNYRVPLLSSGFHLSVAGQDLRLPYSGSFWADGETLDIVRLTTQADDIPATIRIAEAVQAVEYSAVHLSGEVFLLPQTADEALRYWSGEVNRNRTEFSHWRRYQGISALSFSGFDQEDPVAATEVPLEQPLPGGLRVQTILETPIDSETAIIGDPIRASVSARVRVQKEAILPESAVLKGRIRWLERRKDSCLLGIEFFEVTWDGKRANFVADLIDVHEPTGTVDRQMVGDQTVAMQSRSRRAVDLHGGLLTHLRTVETYEIRDIPGVALLAVHANPFRLAPGVRLVWKTE